MSWFDWFLVTGTMFFVTQIIKFVFMVYHFVKAWYDVKYHDPMCEECADELMSETFKGMRDER